jgi:hypothetical protein
MNACGILFLCLGLIRVAATEEAAVAIAPTKFVLRPKDISDPAAWKRLTLSITNRTAGKLRFNRFYNNWSPILISEKAGEIPLGFSRDATMPPRESDFPFVKPGHTITTTIGCKVINEKSGLGFVLSDRTGGAFFGTVEPGHYKLAISYGPRIEAFFVSLAVEQFGIDPSKTWGGSQTSNWIHFVIEAADNTAK